jgi:anaerobic magnesium-protoporphyrin IX monomethyl ester cyclase
VISRILMISTSREVAPQPTVPIGAAWVAQSLHLSGFDVRFLDLCFHKNPLQAVDDAIRSIRPDGIGISVRNLDNCDFLSPGSFLPELKQITDFIKSRTDARLLLGGAGVSIMPRELLSYLHLDHAIVGEGERAAVLFFRAQTDEDLSQVPGLVSRLVSRMNSRPVSAQPAPWVMPRMSSWIETKPYLNLEPVLPVQGKRGCANRCLYCTYNRIEGERWRLRDPADVVDEIAGAMRETGAKEFEFVDSIFNEPEGYLETLMEEILRRPLKARLRASSLSPKGLTKEQLRLMERAGMTSFVITPESASDVTLASLRKGFCAAEVSRAAELLSGSSIRALWCFLLGGPEEDENTLRDTMNFINKRMPKKDAAFITTGIRIFPRTPLHSLAIAEEIVDLSDDLLMPAFYFSSKITPETARDTLQKGLADPAQCIFLSDTRLNSLSTARRIGTLLHLPSPFWRYAGYMNRVTISSRVINRSWSGNPAHRK